eukprot:TRINITY_DN90958_c0_g1_i1.p1 TRINITY_DN90958_c0_g1~~TRINITY_DN90958_c0_g1_i1.p1  ORF type:complete len:784 (-),score=104.72 TRINITY_DN90958_c0_g1_i1:247-2598(-)
MHAQQMQRGGARAAPASPARLGAAGGPAPLHTSRNLAAVPGMSAYQQPSQVTVPAQQAQRARPSVVQPQHNQRQVMNWLQSRGGSFTAQPKTPGSDMSTAPGTGHAAGPATPAGPAAHSKAAFPKNPNMPSPSLAMAPSASASAAAPPGSTASRQVRVNPRPSLAMSLAAKPGPGAATSNQSSSSCAAGRGTSTSALSSPRRAASPVKQHAQQAGSCEAQSRTSRMRYSSAGRSFEQSGPPTGRAVVLTTQQEAMGSPCASSQRAGARLGAYRSSSSLEGSPRRFRGACERALSAGVRIGEGPSMSRGATASSSSALHIASTPEVNGPVRRSSAGAMAPSSSLLARQKSGRRPGSGSPPRGGDSRGGGLTQGPPSSRGAPARKPTACVAVAGVAASSMIAGANSGGTEPEAEPALVGPSKAVVLLSEADAAGGGDNTTAAAIAAAQQASAARAAENSAREAWPPEEQRERMPPARVHEIGLDGDGFGDLQLHVRLLPSEMIKWQDIQIVQQISMGSFGEVHLARYRGEEVSVKRCILGADGSMTKEQLHNLEREINTYRALSHRHIVKYIGCILEHPNLAVVTEYLPNGNLFDLLFMQRVNLVASIRLRIAVQLSLAVSYMHSCDPTIIHRDLKTQNLVLDANYSIKVCDFGKTQAMTGDQGLLTGQDTGGSPRYMAPECFQIGAYITEKVDIWSLGCCLVEILGGPLPYEDVPQMSEVQRLLEHHVGPLVPPWFTPRIQPALAKCFEFEPSRRGQVSEVLLALKELTPQELEAHGMDKRRVR